MYTAKKASEAVIEGIPWEIAFFNYVDYFRKSKEKQKIIEDKPVLIEDKKLDSLLKSITLYLCDETNIIPPEWAEENGWLSRPWFVCELSRLYSFSIVETPIRFKQNNIFVLSNFMDRI